MMTNAALEVLHIGGEKLLNVVNKEFSSNFSIIARTPEYIVLGDGGKNVSFCRSKNRVLERNVLNSTLKIDRKR